MNNVIIILKFYQSFIFLLFISTSQVSIIGECVFHFINTINNYYLTWLRIIAIVCMFCINKTLRKQEISHESESYNNLITIFIICILYLLVLILVRFFYLVLMSNSNLFIMCKIVTKIIYYIYCYSSLFLL